MLAFSLTDPLKTGDTRVMQQVRDTLAHLTDPYQRAYYSCLASERNGMELLRRASLGSSTMSYDALRSAMDWYEKAETIRPADNDDWILRWNTCGRGFCVKAT